MPTGVYPRRSLAERFWPRVRKGDGCWEWQGHRSSHGYGKIGCGGKDIGTHRVAWELAHGPIPAGMHVCHRCDNPPCVRPDHLFLGTHSDNMRDLAEKGLAGGPVCEANALKTHCPQGHAYTPANTYTHNGKRQCRICRNAGSKRRRKARRARRRHCSAVD